MLLLILVYVLVTVIACKYSHFPLLPFARDFCDRGVCVFVQKLYGDYLTYYCM